MPDYLSYHRSLTKELHALKDRIRNLSEHWGTDGEYKEAALKNVLRRHLPDTVIVGRGFIVTRDRSSTQIDLMVVDGDKPTLFRDGDLMIVTPDCVLAIVEVKTSIDTLPAMRPIAKKLCENAFLCHRYNPWTGIFVYEQKLKNYQCLLKASQYAHDETRIPLNCIAYGKNRFLRYWTNTEIRQWRNGVEDDPLDGRNRWRVYHLEDFASAYFIGNLVDSIARLQSSNSSFAWYPIPGGKNDQMLGEIGFSPEVEEDIQENIQDNGL